ncbi:phosphonate ABC transporter ATP-binding protein [Synechococcus sp. PCC 7336]|uniref:phosphonate ABC transporter ATP-binding protein n=1 Tax=Synechococcus sp. PCC 7336 TaxID=195250 RepID=UPI00034896D0|nr:phosphonate ABC transporter ATP-binding protein [Synechococcus sp. PCC 7336]
MSDGPPICQLQNVNQRFGNVEALTGVSLRIAAGERVALIGPSGAGKSTLLGLLNGTVFPTTGTVTVLGRDLAQLGPQQLRQVQRSIGTVYQQFHLVGNLRAIHNVNAGHLGRWPGWKSLWSLIWPQEVETAKLALERVGISEKLYERTDRLSGGQQQRLALARVLVQQPKLILADEPIASLDPERSREIVDLLRQLCVESGITLVTSLHAVEFARSHCDRIVGLRRGRIAFDCLAAEVSSQMLQDLYRLEGG